MNCCLSLSRRILSSRQILFDDPIRWVKLRHAGLFTGNPAKDVDLRGVSQRIGDLVVQDLHNGMSTEIFVVVDVRLHPYTFLTIKRFLVVLMKSELDIGFSKANFLEARCGVAMEERWINFRRENPRYARFHFRNELRDDISEKSVWRKCRPLNASEVVQRRTVS